MFGKTKCIVSNINSTKRLSLSSCGSSLNTVLLGWSHESRLIVGCLEATMTKFGRCIDELQFNLLQCNAFGAGH